MDVSHVRRAVGAAGRVLRIGAVAVLLGSPVQAQDAPLTLEAVLAQVEAVHPALRAARLEAAALATRPAQVGTRPDPMVGLMYGALPAMGMHGPKRASVRVEQAVPYAGSLRLQREIAALEAEEATRLTDALAADLRLEATLAYIDLHRLQQLDALVAGFQDELRGFEEAAAVRYEVGTGTQEAVLKAQLEKHTLAQQRLDLQRQQRSAAETLARLTNAPGGTRFYQSAALAAPPVPEVAVAELALLAAATRPEAEALAGAAARAAREVELAERAFRPDLSVVLERPMPMMAGGDNMLAVGVMARVPLQRSRLRAQVEEAQLRQQAAEARQEAFQMEIETAAADLLFALEQEQQTLDLYRTTLLPQAASTVEASLTAYTTGRTGFLELLDAQRTQFALRTAYADTLARYLLTAARLERLLGAPLAELDRLALDRAEP